MSPFLMLCVVGFTARLGYQMARAPVLPLFAEELAADAWLIGLILGASTITGVFLKFPAGALSDVLGRRHVWQVLFSARSLIHPEALRSETVNRVLLLLAIFESLWEANCS